ncbi:MAG: enoyl-CoA hydratase/isomerase family protein [Proteobacteria bacterium]|nr:enoyl-CoA hydratase/isomerase family protein [Pseudomonadota bacterium]
MAELCLYQRQEHVGRIRLNRPEKRNALDLGMWEAIGRAVAQAADDPEARVVVVSGEGKSFCAGLNLDPAGEMAQHIMESASAAQKEKFFETVCRVQDVHTALERLRQPTIALIQGHCLGAGLELAVCCDLRLASAGTQFALPEATLGLITDVGGLQRLPRIVGPTKAREIAFLARRFDADEALAMGLLNQVCADEAALEKTGLEWAAEIAAKPPLAVWGAKAVFLHDEQEGLEAKLRYNAARNTMVVPSEDLKEALLAFMQKRPGQYHGK